MWQSLDLFYIKIRVTTDQSVTISHEFMINNKQIQVESAFTPVSVCNK